MSNATPDLVKDMIKLKMQDPSSGHVVNLAVFPTPLAALTLLSRATSDPFLIPPIALLHLAEFLHRNKFSTLFQLVCEYSLQQLDASAGREELMPSERRALVRSLLELCCETPEFYAELIFAFLKHVLPKPGNLDYQPNYLDYVKNLRPATLLASMRHLLSQPNAVDYIPLLDALTAAVLSLQPPRRKRLASNATDVGTWALYRYLMMLMENGHRPSALKLFSTLIQHDRFPSNATLGSNPVDPSTLKDSASAFDITLLMGMARACQLYGWTQRTVVVAEALISRCDAQTYIAKAEMISTVLHSIIMDLVSEDRPASLSAADQVFRACLYHPVILSPPPDLLDRLYWALHRSKLHDTMQNLVFDIYGLRMAQQESTTLVPSMTVGIDTDGLESDDQFSSNTSAPPPAFPAYQPPSGEACLGLLKHATLERRDPQVARIVAQEQLHALNDHSPAEIPRHHSFEQHPALVPEFISLYAKSGLLEEAAQLWRAFKKVQGAEMVIGDSGMVIGLVKGLMNQAEKPDRREIDGTREIGVAGSCAVDGTPQTVYPPGTTNSAPQFLTRTPCLNASTAIR